MGVLAFVIPDIIVQQRGSWEYRRDTLTGG